MERTKIIRRCLNGQWTVMDSSFLKSLTGTARACGTRDKSCNFTVHYCPLSKTKHTHTDTYRCFPRILTGTAHAHTVRVRKVTILSVSSVSVRKQRESSSVSFFPYLPNNSGRLFGGLREKDYFCERWMRF